MKLLWNNTRRIERFLRKQLSLKSQALSAQQLQTDPAYATDVLAQQRTYHLLTLLGRRQLKREIQEVERKVLQEHPTLEQEITAIFR
ncbi:MAG: hypothetical protein AAF798_18200 [Bacteroidota bacterium]